MASATHYIPVSEKTVINSLIISVSLQPLSINLYVIKNSAMRKNTNMRCVICTASKTVRTACMYGSLGSNEQQIHTYT
jgi:hypothetical protein